MQINFDHHCNGYVNNTIENTKPNETRANFTNIKKKEYLCHLENSLAKRYGSKNK